jgi:uncharacterized membrane protein YfbV (UPF0208 family)
MLENYIIANTGSKDVKILMASAKTTRDCYVVMYSRQAQNFCHTWPLNKDSAKGEVFLKNIVVRANEKGWMTGNMVKEWIQLVWQHCPGALLCLPSLLVLES